VLPGELDDLVHRDDRGGQERQGEHEDPLAPAQGDGVEQALEHVQLDGGPGEDPAEDDPAEEREHWPGPRRVPLAAHDHADVDPAERDDGEGHGHVDRRVRGAWLAGSPFEHGEGGGGDHEPGDEPADDLRDADDLGAWFTWRPVHDSRVGDVGDEADHHCDDDEELAEQQLQGEQGDAAVDVQDGGVDHQLQDRGQDGQLHPDVGGYPPVDVAAKLDGADQGGEVVVGQHDLGRLLGYL
jgi:hypothetical protein